MAFSAEDIVPDSPTNNFCTLNPLTTYNPTLSDGNLYSSIGASYKWGVGTIFIPSTGKWIFEIFFLTNTSTNNYNSCGVITLSFDQSQAAAAAGFYGINDASTFGSSFIQNGTRQGSITLPANTLIQCIIDRDAGELTFTKDGTLQTGTGSTVTLPNSEVPLMAAIGDYAVSIITNFGQDPTFGGLKSPTTTYTDANGIGAFYYQPPTGALALCTANLTDLTPTVIDDVPQDYFKAVTWTGNNSASRDIANVNFTPDFIWIKQRNQAYSSGHQIYDSVRGLGPEKEINSSSTNAEGAGNIESYGYPSEFLSNGFRVVDGTTGRTYVNQSGNNYVAWCWKAGGAPDLTSSPTKPFAKDGVLYETLSAANITAGSITPTAMSVNTDAGFSIVKYEGNSTSGSTLPHGLSQRPDMVILKNLDTTAHWKVWHNVLPTSGTPIDEMALNLTGGAGLGNNNFRGIGLQLITLGDNTQSNNSSYNYIAYCWHSVEGYSKFGSYTGNGSPDGPFVYCGFRPAFVMVKNAGQAANWVMYDNKRNTSNLTNKKLAANLSYEENEVATLGDDSIGIDLLSNGFKIRTTGPNHNNSNINYIFMAFSEQPFKFSNAR